MSNLFEDEDYELPTLDEVVGTHHAKPTTSFLELALQCLKKAVPLADRGQRHNSRPIMIVRVPSSEWLTDTKAACRLLWPNTQVMGFAAGEKWKTSDIQTQVRRHVVGNALIVVSDDPERSVPAPLLHAALKHYNVQRPDKKTFLAVARTIVGGDVARAFRGLDISLLDYTALCLTLVTGESPRQAASKARKALAALDASVGRENVPRLRDLHGYGTGKQWALDLIADIKGYKEGLVAWSEVDHGALFFGPAGTGKSLLAQVIAREAKVPFVETSIASYFASGSGNLDGVIRQQRDAFAKASAAAPSILFLDELDALPSRGANGHNSDFWRPVLTDLLMLLDSASSDRAGVVLLAATNRVQDVDSALLRAGRMDRLIHIPPPGPEGLAAILRHYLGEDLAGDNLLPLTLARPGATGADAVGWVKAVRRKARHRGGAIVLGDLAEEITGVDLRPQGIRTRVAVHETGHVVAALALGIGVRSVTIAVTDDDQGRAAIDLRRHGILTKSELEAAVVVLLAGRAAEAVMMNGQVSNGSGGDEESDLGRATEIVGSIYSRFALGDDLIHRVQPDPELGKFINEELKRLYGIATGIIITHLDASWSIVRELLGQTTLDAGQLRELFLRPAGPEAILNGPP